jgi:hypothetical protein
VYTAIEGSFTRPISECVYTLRFCGLQARLSFRSAALDLDIFLGAKSAKTHSEIARVKVN